MFTWCDEGLVQYHISPDQKANNKQKPREQTCSAAAAGNAGHLETQMDSLIQVQAGRGKDTICSPVGRTVTHSLKFSSIQQATRSHIYSQKLCLLLEINFRSTI